MSAWKPAHTFTDDRTAGDTLTATAMEDGVTVAIEQPWAAVAETGFGATCSVQLSPDAARDLALWLLRAAEQAER